MDLIAICAESCYHNESKRLSNLVMNLFDDDTVTDQTCVEVN